MAHTNLTDLKNKFEDGDRPTGEDFKNLLDSCHNTKLDTPVTITGTLTVSGSSSFKSPVAIRDDVTCYEKLTVDGATLLKDNLIVYKNTSINGNLSVSGATRSLGTLAVSRSATMEEDLTVDGATVLKNTLEVQQSQHNLSTLTVDGVTLLSNQLTVHGPVILNSTLGVDDNLSVHGIAVFDNQITGNGGSLITGDSVFMDNLHVKGDLRVDGNAYLEAGPSGEINVGDSSSDNVKFNADVASNILPNGHKQYNIGAPDNMWSNVYAGCFIAGKDVEVTGDIIVTGTVDGRDVSDDGNALDSVVSDMSVVSDTSASWDTSYLKSLANEQNLVVVSAASAGWNDTQATVTGSKDAWSDARSTVKAFSASWEESADIQAIADELAVVGVVSADWSDARTTVKNFSGHWSDHTKQLGSLDDVNVSGAVHNSVLKYDQDHGWVAGTDLFSTPTENGEPLPALDTFIALTDTLVSYAGNGEKFLKVNNSETGIYAADLDTADWDDARSTVNTFSASWEESADIQVVADDVATVGAVSGDWNDIKARVDISGPDWDATATHVSHGMASWWSVHNDVSVASGDWNDTRTTLGATSGEWNDTRTTLNATSGDWNDTRSSLQAASGDWNESQSVVNSTSADWTDARTTLNATSGDWNDTRSSLQTASGDWNESQSVVNNTSADWNSVYSHINSVSGQGLATVDADGKLLVDQIPELSITRVHTANNPGDVELLSPTTGIQVGDVVVVMSTHDNIIALIDEPTGVYDAGAKDYTGYAKLAMPDGLVQTVNGKPGPSVVLNPDDFLDDVTAHKFVSQQNIDNWTDTRTTLGTTSGDWNDTRSSLQAASGDWNDTRSTLTSVSGDWNDTRSSLMAASGDWNESQSAVNSTSGDWNESQSVVSNTSGDWNDTRSSLMATSGDWNDTRSSLMATSGDWNSVYSFVNADSATNNTTYNDDTYVNVAGDTMTGNLNIDGGELVVGGNITMAGDLIHQNDTGTRISFNDDIISLETNGQEFITIDGTAPTPDAVVINDPASTAIHFKIKSVTTDDALYVDGDTGRIGIGISDFGGLESMQCWVNQGLGVVGGFIVNGGNAEIGGAVVASSNVETAGHFISAGENLLDIFSTDTDVHGDMTVHGSISAQDELTISKFANVSGDMVVGGDLTADGDFTGKTVSSGGSYSTIDDTGQSVTGVTQEVNIGGHVLHIVNGLIVKVTDE